MSKSLWSLAVLALAAWWVFLYAGAQAVIKQVTVADAQCINSTCEGPCGKKFRRHQGVCEK